MYLIIKTIADAATQQQKSSEIGAGRIRTSRLRWMLPNC
jgi:hypothetical protein